MTEQTSLFDTNRNYQPTDPEIVELLGNTAKQAQMRHYGRSPSFYRLGRKIIYTGADLNAWADAQRVDTLCKEKRTRAGGA
ncbi:hypothetical protein GCM10008927_06440 [Amylibacter ulvae]|uniref:DNA-binding protein n=1 Tax=Paramylibacter ulvae TaxID=1651968 RepID=A0ABQ3CUE9_9RHOB|nr:MerR family transcriptional regulator [Amylibacter ulvae]GHA44356.1 hypothetical protein GCM10008927_06440 [Amylibacter ulvae]